MNVGIILYSHTGNTLSVAERLGERLKKQGHVVKIDRIGITPDDPNSPSISLTYAPETVSLDALVFASPVHGFQISRAMSLYLQGVGSLIGKKAVCFVTHHFPFAWMGGKGSVGKMRNLVQEKGAEVLHTAVIDWKNAHREEEIERLIHEVETLQGK
jgi:flavodoxin